jgi:DNA polymerase-1
MTLLIDADWLIYAACSACECDIRWDEWTHTLHLEPADVHAFIGDRVHGWKELTGSKNAVMCFSDYPSFRYDLYPDYKANRVGKRKPLGLRDLRLWVEQHYETRTMVGLEGDDVLAILATNGGYSNPIIVSPDKDMRTVPCQLLAKDELESITSKAAFRHWMLQTLTGDQADNYPGIKGCGPVKAEKILGDEEDPVKLWASVVEAYRKAGLTFSDALLNARLARILRHGDYDYRTGEVKLWDPSHLLRDQ